MAATFLLDLILYVQSSDTRPCVLSYGPGDHGGSTEARVCICNHGDRGIEAAHHLCALDEIIQGGNGQIWLTETGCGGGCTTVEAIRQVWEEVME